MDYENLYSTATKALNTQLEISATQTKRITELETEIQEVSNQLMELYDECVDSTEPAVYGAILGLHERLNKVLKGEK